MLVLELSAGGFDDADFVGAGVVPIYRREESAMASHVVGYFRGKGLGVLRIPPALLWWWC